MRRTWLDNASTNKCSVVSDSLLDMVKELSLTLAIHSWDPNSRAIAPNAGFEKTVVTESQPFSNWWNTLKCVVLLQERRRVRSVALSSQVVLLDSSLGVLYVSILKSGFYRWI